MTGQAAPDEQVDWAGAERRARRWDRVAILPIVGVFAGAVLLTGDFAGLSGAAAWAVVGDLAAFLTAMVALQSFLPALRARQSGNYRVVHALQQHLGPGPGLRERPTGWPGGGAESAGAGSRSR